MTTTQSEGSPAWAGTDALTREGRVVRIRPLRPEDADELRELHAGVGEDSLRYRFFSVSRHAASEYAEHLLQQDPGSLCLVALAEGRVAGVASAEPAEPGSMEVAFLIADAQHGQGIGSLLLEHLAEMAREHGVTRFVADVLAGNRLMHQVFRDIGFQVTETVEDGVAHVEVDLTPVFSVYASGDARESVSERHSLRPLLHPESVVVVGAKRDGTGVGSALLGSILRGGFPGRVGVVHPAGGRIGGLEAVRSCRDLEAPADLAVIAVPAARVLEALTDVADGGTRAAIVVSSGFRELGADGAAMQAEITSLARQRSVRLVGPNCLGLLSQQPGSVLNATFADLRPPIGTVAVASQSGGVGIAFLDAASSVGLGVGSFVSLGNKADVSGNDLLAAWLEDPTVSSVCLYLESFGNAHKFARIARGFARSKPLLAVVGGRSEGGRRAGASHTAAAASDAVVVDALLQHTGAITCRDATDLATTALVLEEQPLPAGPRLGIVSNAGGMGVLAADAAAAEGLEVPRLSPGLGQLLTNRLSGSVGWSNPVDTGAGASTAQIAEAVRLVAGSGEVDALLVVLVATTMTDVRDVLRLLGEQRAGHDDIPAVLVVLGDGPVGHDDAPGFTVLPHHEQAVRALSRGLARRRWLERSDTTPVPTDLARQDAVRRRARTLLATGEGPATWVDFPAAAELLDAYGLNLSGERVRGEAEAALAATRCGFPVVLKLATPGLHKTEGGFVRVGLPDTDSVRRVVQVWTEQDPDPEVLVQPVAEGVEIAVGLVRDPGLGPLVMVAAGGVDIDVWDDRAFLLAPVGPDDVREALRKLRVWSRLEGHRGAPPAAVDALVDAVVAVSRLGAEVPEVAELDLNPVMVSPTEVTLVDARLRLAPASAFRDAPALSSPRR